MNAPTVLLVVSTMAALNLADASGFAASISQVVLPNVWTKALLPVRRVNARFAHAGYQSPFVISQLRSPGRSDRKWPESSVAANVPSGRSLNTSHAHRARIRLRMEGS